MQYFHIENPYWYIGILLLILGSAIIISLAEQTANRREIIVNGKKQLAPLGFFVILMLVIRLIFKLFFEHSKTWITTIRKHKVCRTPAGQIKDGAKGTKKGKADSLAVKVLILYFLLFLNSGHWLYIVSLLDSRINLWEFQRYGLPNLEFLPYVGKYLLLVTWNWNVEHLYISVWFNAVYIVLGLSGLHKTVSIWFPHSQKSELIERIILKDPQLPDDYDRIEQINQDQVRVSYIGNSFDGDIFVSKEKKKQLMGGTGHEIDVALLPEHGKVLITFGSKLRNVPPPPVWDKVDNSYVRQVPNEFEGYTYAFKTYALHVHKHVLKIGKCTDPEATLKAHRRSTPHLKKFVLCIRQSRLFNESLAHRSLKKYWIPSEDGRGGEGEFFDDCDATWRIIKGMLEKLPERDLVEVPEGLFDKETFAYAN